jgi:hypothetical protein
MITRKPSFAIRSEWPNLIQFISASREQAVKQDRRFALTHFVPGKLDSVRGGEAVGGSLSHRETQRTYARLRAREPRVAASGDAASGGGAGIGSRILQLGEETAAIPNEGL